MGCGRLLGALLSATSRFGDAPADDRSYERPVELVAETASVGDVCAGAELSPFCGHEDASAADDAGE